jgi:hypothetical protein
MEKSIARAEQRRKQRKAKKAALKAKIGVAKEL